MSINNLIVAFNLLSKLDLRNDITDQFESNNGSEYIFLHNKNLGIFEVAITEEFGYIVPDFIFKKINSDTFYVGERINDIQASYALEKYPLKLNKEQAKNKVVNLLEHCYEIVTNPFLSHGDVKYYSENKAIKIIKMIYIK